MTMLFSHHQVPATLMYIFDDQTRHEAAYHITCRMCRFQQHQLQIIRRSLPTKVIHTLLHAIVACRLDHCNSLPFGLPACDINRLHSVENAAAQLFGCISCRDHATSVLRNKLSVSQLINFRTEVLFFKLLNGMTPQYLSAMCNPASNAIALRRHRSAHLVDVFFPSCYSSTDEFLRSTWISINSSESVEQFHY